MSFVQPFVVPIVICGNCGRMTDLALATCKHCRVARRQEPPQNRKQRRRYGVMR